MHELPSGDGDRPLPALPVEPDRHDDQDPDSANPVGTGNPAAPAVGDDRRPDLVAIGGASRSDDDPWDDRGTTTGAGRGLPAIRRAADWTIDDGTGGESGEDEDIAHDGSHGSEDGADEDGSGTASRAGDDEMTGEAGDTSGPWMPPPGTPPGSSAGGPGAAYPGGAGGATRWYRSRERVIAGVAGGLADSLALDPVFVRLVFVGLAVLSPLTLMIYAAAYLAMAAHRGARPPSTFRRMLAVAVGGLGALGVINTADTNVDPWKFFALLIGMAAALWYPHRSGRPRPGAEAQWGPPSSPGASAAGAPWVAPGTPTAGSGGATSWRRAPTDGTTEIRSTPGGPWSDGEWPGNSRPGGEWPTGTWATPVPATTTEPSAFPTAPRQRTRRRRSPFGRIVLAVALATVAIGFAAGSPRDVKIACAIAAVICAAGLLLGMVFGRARWLVIPGLLAAGGAVTAGSVEGLGVQLDAPWNHVDRYQTVVTQADVPVIDIGAGVWQLDLSGITEDVAITGKVGLGGLDIYVPEDARVSLHARTGLGTLRTPTGRTTGYRREITEEFGPITGHHITLDLVTGLGGVNVWYGANYAEKLNPVDLAPVPPQFPPGVVGYTEQGGAIYGGGATIVGDAILLADGTEIRYGQPWQLGSRVTVTPDGWLILGETQVEPDGTVHLVDGTVVYPPGSPGAIESGQANQPVLSVPVDPNATVFETMPPATASVAADPSVATAPPDDGPGASTPVITAGPATAPLTPGSTAPRTSAGPSTTGVVVATTGGQP